MLQEENILQNVVEPQFQDIFVSLLAWYCSIPIINQMPYTPDSCVWSTWMDPAFYTVDWLYDVQH